MPRYVALLRGVSPTNCSMAELKRCVERAGFTNVKTVLASGNVAFDSTSRSVATIEQRLEPIFTKQFGRTFHTIVRSTAELEALLKEDPFSKLALPAGAKRVVTFARKLAKPKHPLPIERDGAQLLMSREREAFSAYLPTPKGPVFMELIKATFGTDVTTRTWDTVAKCAKA